MIPKTFVLLPAYNEKDSLEQLIPDLLAAARSWGCPAEILVVNDGSTDGTETLLKAQAGHGSVRELKHPQNRGYGAALNTGFSWVVRNGGQRDAVVSLDCDRTHSPEYVAELLRKLDQGYDVVTASYSMPGGQLSGVPPLRRLMSQVINLFFRAAWPMPGAHTYTNGFRAYRVGLLQQVQAHFGEPLIQETGFPGGVELFLKAGAIGARAGEVPFHLRYENRGGGSKIRLAQTIAKYLQLLWRARQFRRQ